MNTSDNDSDENKQHSQVVCGVNFQKSIKMLITAHSQDLLEFENEFQKRKTEWDKERTYLIDLVNRFKQQSKTYKQILIKHNINLDGTTPVITSPSQNTVNNINNGDIIDNNNTSGNGSAEKKKRVYKKKNSLNSTLTTDNNNNNSTTTTLNNTIKKKTPSSTSKKRKSPHKDNFNEEDELDLPNEFIPTQDNNKYDDNTMTILNSQSFMKNKIINDNDTNNNNSNSTQSTSLNREKKKIKTKDVVRNQEEREKLQGFECEHCKEFYDSVLGDDEETKKNLLNKCSRHRHEDTPPSTPPGFWDFNFDTPKKNNTTTTTNNNNTNVHNNFTISSNKNYDDLDF